MKQNPHPSFGHAVSSGVKPARGGGFFNEFFTRTLVFSLMLVWLLALPARAGTTNSLVWHAESGRVSADLRGEPLLHLLNSISRQTGWQIFVEPQAKRVASTKFANLPVGDALKMLLGDLNFALVPQTNGPQQLYVFSTQMKNATKRVGAGDGKDGVARHVPNELIIRVKPGMDVEALAKSLGAKIIGGDAKLGIYRLQFDNEADTDSAMANLKSNSDVLAVDYNYYYDPPPSAQVLANPATGPVSLTLNPPNTDDCANLTVGLIDTPVQSLGAALNPFMLPSISVTGDVTSPSTTDITHGTGMAYTILETLATAPQNTPGSQVSPSPVVSVNPGLSGLNPVKPSTSVRILPVDVYGNSPTTTSWYVALGVQAAVNKGATVLNLSLGSSGDSTVLDSVLQQAVADGIIVFAAAGNEPVAAPTYPAASSGVNAVTALSGPGQLASYADFGSFVNMALPGSSVVYLGNTAYLMQGTSVSTAYASGIAAGTRSGNCGLTWPQIQTSMDKSFPVPSQ
jgi:hypothetical protein